MNNSTEATRNDASNESRSDSRIAELEADATRLGRRSKLRGSKLRGAKRRGAETGKSATPAAPIMRSRGGDLEHDDGGGGGGGGSRSNGRRDASDPAASDGATSSRRGMLRMAGAAAAGAAAVAVVGKATPAAAVTGDPLKVGTTSFGDAGEVTYLVNGTISVLADSADRKPYPTVGGAVTGYNISTATDAIDRGGVLGISSLFLGPGIATSAGVLGLSSSTSMGPAVYGRSDSDVVGASAGLRAKSAAGPAVQLVPVATGAPTTGQWSVGAIQPDVTGRLFYCVADGTPGIWRELTAPSLHIISPVRVFDSRLPLPSPGKLTTGNSKVVSVKDARDESSGTVTIADVVPAGATAIVGNLTITKTVGTGGYLSVVPGDATASSGSSINWFGPNQDLANGLTAKLDANRQLKVFCGGDSATDFIIDVTGYYL